MDLVQSWPTADDIATYSAELNMPIDVVIRDIARIVTVAQMAAAGELSNDLVVCGGFGMRLRGSPRFTVYDADTSSRTVAPAAMVLSKAVTYDDPALEIAPGDHHGFHYGSDLITAKPVNYTAYFAQAGAAPPTGDFSLTVAARGLLLPADMVPLRHPYPALVIAPMDIPVMNLTEQLAEKILGWCAHGLLKHYLDLAWAVLNLRGEIRAEKFGDILDQKLAAARSRFPEIYAGFPDRGSLRAPLEQPTSSYAAPKGTPGDDGASRLKFPGRHLTRGQAEKVVREYLIPLLYGR